MSVPEPADERSGLPHRFEAVGEALISGSDVIVVCSVAGQGLAPDGGAVAVALTGQRAYTGTPV